MILVTAEMVAEFFNPRNRNVAQIEEFTRRINEERDTFKVGALLGVLTQLKVTPEERTMTLTEWDVVNQFIDRLELSDRELLRLIINSLN